MAAISGLSANIERLDQRIASVEQKIGEVETNISAQLSDVQSQVRKVHILTGSLVESNIRLYLKEEFGDSFVRDFNASELNGAVYLATPRELRKLSGGFGTLNSRQDALVENLWRSPSIHKLVQVLTDNDDLQFSGFPNIAAVLCKPTAHGNDSNHKNATSAILQIANSLNGSGCASPVTDNENSGKKSDLNGRGKGKLKEVLRAPQTTFIIFPLLLALAKDTIRRCMDSLPPDVPKINISNKNIWDCLKLQLDIRGSCEVRNRSDGYIRMGEIKSCLSGYTKQESMLQLTIRIMCVSIALALCDPSITSIQADGFSVVFKSTSSYEHSYKFDDIPLTTGANPRKITVDMRLKSICPPNCGMFEQLVGGERTVSLSQKAKRDAKHARAVAWLTQSSKSE